MAIYREERLKLTNAPVSKLKFAGKNKTGTTLKITTKKKNKDEEKPHESFLKTRQKTKIRNAFTNNMSTDTNLREGQTSKIIQYDALFGYLLGNLGTKALKNVAFPFAKK